ncbi:MAG TPA: RNA polymerase subunit sigma-70 [Parvularcula sp.]|nr:RNA polymerase subunit sigma-70 [Parvularcula sp.]
MSANEEQLAGLMRRARTGDGRAYEELLRRLIPLLRSYFKRRASGHETEADDFVQDCLIAIHQRQITYLADRPLMPWVYAIARHKLIDRFRSRKYSIGLKHLDEYDAAYETEAAINARLDIETLLETASPKQRAAIIATKIHGDSVADHAADARTSVSDIKVSIHRGLKALTRFARGER